MQAISDFVWGTPLLILILSMGIYYSLKTKFIQRKSFTAFKSFNKSAYRAFATSLGATVGTGSVIGVGFALSAGGAGAIFWMWVSAVLGMSVAYAEGYLSQKYRGGMWLIIEKGLRSRHLAIAYSLFATLACFGMGIMAQTNSVSEGLAELGVPPVAAAIAVSGLLLCCLVMGSDKIGRLCGAFVPILSAGYIILAICVIAVNFRRLPSVFSEIFTSAFGIKQAAGGVGGYGIKIAISQGVRRGIFSNEAGLGTTASLHANAEGIAPHSQGLINMLEVAIDTLVICTLTALALLTSDVNGVAEAFSRSLGNWAGNAVTLAVAGFAIATSIGWVSIGRESYLYLTKNRLSHLYTLLAVVASAAGCLFPLESVITLSDIFNGLMAIPCLTALWLLRGEVTQSLPVEPKPFSPRSDSGSDSASSISGKITGVTTSCAKRSPGWKV